MTSDDPAPLVGIIISVIVGILAIIPIELGTDKINVSTYDETSFRLVLERVSVPIARPEHPEKRKLAAYYREYGSFLHNDDFLFVLYDVASDFQVDPLFIAALSILESSGGRNAIGKNYYGYCPAVGCIRFDTDREALLAVAATLRRYNNSGYYGIREKASIWRTGRLGDDSGYPEKIESIINEIRYER